MKSGTYDSWFIEYVTEYKNFTAVLFELVARRDWFAIIDLARSQFAIHMRAGGGRFLIVNFRFSPRSEYLARAREINRPTKSSEFRVRRSRLRNFVGSSIFGTTLTFRVRSRKTTTTGGYFETSGFFQLFFRG